MKMAAPNRQKRTLGCLSENINDEFIVPFITAFLADESQTAQAVIYQNAETVSSEALGKTSRTARVFP